MIFLGREISEQRDYSEAVAQEIDEEVRGLVNWAYDRARTLLRENRDKLDIVANRLLEIETIEQEEFLALMGVTPVRASHSGPVSEPPATPRTRIQPEENADHPPLGTAPSPA
jgi:cell division protease FtsH